MAKRQTIYCFCDKETISFSEWPDHSSHHSELFIFPPYISNSFTLVRELFHSPTKNVFHMKDNMPRNPKNYAITSYFSTKEEAKLKEEISKIFYSGIPNIVRLSNCIYIPMSHDSNQGNLITITEFYDRKLDSELSKFLKKDLIFMFLLLCKGVQKLHSYGYFHSFISIKNIVLNPKNEPILLGLTNCQKISQPNYELIYETTNKAIWPPEFLKGEINEKFDIWCLGILLHQLLANLSFPFELADDPKKLHSILRKGLREKTIAQSIVKISPSVGSTGDQLHLIITSKYFF